MRNAKFCKYKGYLILTIKKLIKISKTSGKHPGTRMMLYDYSQQFILFPVLLYPDTGCRHLIVAVPFNVCHLNSVKRR